MNKPQSTPIDHNRVVSLLTLMIFLANHVLGYCAPIHPAIPAQTVLKEFPLNLLGIQIPSGLGKIEEAYQSSSAGPVIVLIQNAHAIVEAQGSIKKLIQHFQKQYGVDVVAVEGASSVLDTQIFKSFPDKTLRQKVFEDYFRKEELTGIAAAAIEDEGKTVYHGVEDWPLYEEGLGLYGAAAKNQPQLLEKLSARQKEIQSQKEKIYSKKLLEIDKALHAFRENHNDLIQILRLLSQAKAPERGTQLALLIEEGARGETAGASIEIEVKRLAEKVRTSLRGGRRPTKQSREIASPSARNDMLRDFHEKLQGFRTSRISAEVFALFLRGLVEKGTGKNSLPVPFSVRISGQLARLIKNQKRMRDIEGTKLFRDFEHYAREVKESLFRNQRERGLDKESRKLELLGKLIRLELSREEWTEIKSEIASLTTFARNDSVALLVAGGFHTEGLTQRLKEKNISYVLLTPQINSIPEKTHYREHMRGEVSWKNYFEVENGKINFYKAFVRATRDKLIGVGAGFKPAPTLLKSWRDQIIRDLAGQERLAEAGQYTKFLDEIGQKKKPRNLSEPFRKIETFIEKLRGLDAQGQLTGQNILKLLNPATMEDLAGPVNISPRDPIASFLVGRRQIAKPRSAARLDYHFSMRDTPEVQRKERINARGGAVSGVLQKRQRGTIKGKEESESRWDAFQSSFLGPLRNQPMINENEYMIQPEKNNDNEKPFPWRNDPRIKAAKETVPAFVRNPDKNFRRSSVNSNIKSPTFGDYNLIIKNIQYKNNANNPRAEFRRTIEPMARKLGPSYPARSEMPSVPRELRTLVSSEPSVPRAEMRDQIAGRLPFAGQRQVRNVTQRGFLRNAAAAALPASTLNRFAEAIAGSPDSDRMTQPEADELVIYIRQTSFETLQEALKKAVKKLAISRRTDNAGISQTVTMKDFRRLVGTIKAPANSKTPDLKGDFVLILPREMSDLFLQYFKTALQEARLETVAIVGKGKAADTIAKIVKSQGANPRPVNNVQELKGGEIPLPAGVLERLNSELPPYLFPFRIEGIEDITDPLARDYLRLAQIAALIHTAQIVAAHPDPKLLLRQPELLRAELLKPEHLGGIFDSNSAVIAAVQGRPGLVISAEAFMKEHRSGLRVRQSA